jgi:hypothetical protein
LTAAAPISCCQEEGDGIKTATPKIGTTPGSKASSKPKFQNGLGSVYTAQGGASTPISVLADLQGLHLTEQVDEAELQREQEKYRERQSCR